MSQVQGNGMWEDRNPKILPAHAGCRGLPPGPPERCAAQPRFFAFLVTEARRLDLIFLILNLSPGATNMRDSDFCPLKILSM